MWDNFLKFLNDNKDALGWLFGSGIVLAVLGGFYRLIVWLLKEYRLRKIRSNDNFPFKIIPPNSNVAKEILGGADDDLLADRNIPYQQRIQGRNTRRELEEIVEDDRWILITGRTGLGKTREAVQLAQSLSNEGWTILFLTRDAWLDAPAKLPSNVPERKILFFLDDLNKKCHSSKAEIRPDVGESLTLPINESFQTRLQKTLETFDTFCGKSEIKVIATARNEATSEFDEPSEWDKPGWAKHKELWRRFKLFYLSEPDKDTEKRLLIELAEKVNIKVNSNDIDSLADRNDGTFRNLIENISLSKIEQTPLSSKNFRDTLKGTWEKRYQKATQKHQEAKYIYDAIELSQSINIRLRTSSILHVAELIAGGNIINRIKRKRKMRLALRYLISSENIFHPRDGQIEAKNYRVDAEKYLPVLYDEIYYNWAEKEPSLLIKVTSVTIDRLVLLIIPKSVFDPTKKLSRAEKIICMVLLLEMMINDVGIAYSQTGFPFFAINIYRTALDIKKANLFYRIFYKKSIPISWANLGYSYYLLKSYEEAIQALQKAIELNPKFSGAWNDLGNVYLSLQRHDEAIKAYENAIELDPKSALFWRNIGRVYRILANYEKSIQAYQRALELDAKLVTLWYELAQIFSISKDFDSALSSCKKSVEAFPEDGIVRTSLVGILRRMGQDKEATEQEEVARSLMEKETEYNRACFESICGNTEDAIHFLKIALEQNQTTLECAQQDSDFDFIHDDPRFKELVRPE